jgi:hypothetical protein
MATGATFQNIFFPFDPKSINGCNLWLDAADPNGTGIPPANGATLTTWKDKSVSNFPFTSIGSSYSTSAVNGRPGINIGTNFFGYDPGSAQNNWQEVFALGVWTGGSTFNSFNGFVTSSVNSDGGAGGGILFIGNSGSSNWWGPGNTYVQQFINGTQTGVALPAILNPFIARTHSATTINLQGLRFGVDRSFTDRKWIGFISEVISYNTPLTVLQRQQVEGYLAWKWGTQGVLVASNPYKTGAPQALPTINSAQVGTIPLTILKNRSFVPTQIAGCRLWLDGADLTIITKASSNVTQMIDKSSNAYILTGSPGTYPTQTTTLNGLPVISSAAGQFLQISNFNQNFTTATSFAVVRPTEDITPLNKRANGYPLYCFVVGGSTDSFQFNINYANQAQTGDASKFTVSINKSGTGLLYGALGGASPSTYNPVNTTLLISAVMSGSSGTNFVNLNGTSVSLFLNISGTFPSQTTTLQCIGFPSGSFGFDFAEVIVYGTTLSISQVREVEGYLAWKWGLVASLPAGHPYFNNNSIYPFPSTTPAKTISSKATFKPTNYPGCQLWLDAFDPFGDGSQQKSPLTLTSWVDKSTSARNATMFNGSSIAYSPTAFNNKPALLFTQTQNMSSAAAAGTFPTSFTFFMIYQRTGGGTFDTLVTRTVSNVAAPTDFFTTVSNGNFSRSIGNGTAYTDYNTTSGSNFTNVTTPSLYYANATAATGLLDAFNFATPTDQSSGTLTGVYYGDTATAIYIGTRADSVTTLTASVAEVIVYSTTPSDQQRQQIEGYLAWKWGLVANLPAGHPYKNYPPPPQ